MCRPRAPILLSIATSSMVAVLSASGCHDSTVSEPAREVLHGVEVVDPYRWLEAGDSRVARWVAVRDRTAREALADVPDRVELRAALAASATHRRSTAPKRRGDRYFYTVFDASATDRVSLLVRDGRGAEPRALVDAETLRRTEGLEVGRTVWPSPDGGLLAYGVKQPGARWLMTLRLLHVETGRPLPDRLEGLVGGVGNAVHWTPAGDALYYIRSDEPGPRVLYHRLSGPAEEDAVVFAPPDPQDQDIVLTADLTPDGRHLVVTLRQGRETDHELIVLALDGPRGERLALDSLGEGVWTYVGARGDEIWLHTTAGAPRGRIVALDLRHGTWRELVPESDSVIDRWTGAARVGRWVVIGYRDDALLRIHAVDADSGQGFDVPLPKTGSIWTGFVAEPEGDEFFYTLSDFTDPGTVYGFDLEKRRAAVFRRIELAHDPDDYVTERLFYVNAEGRRSPIFIAYRRGPGAGRPRPAMVYGYGALSWSAAPWFRPHLAAWFDAGGIFALPAIRGGGEYGEEWRQDGLRYKRRNAIADFVAAAEWLVDEGWTTPDLLAAEGQSLGGSLVATASLGRPDLFRATILAFPLIDLLRYERFGQSAGWRSELGAVDDPRDFAAMLERAPLQNVDPDRCPPEVFLLPGEFDETTPPHHAYKLAAALETVRACDRKPLLRVSWGAGHTYGATPEDVWDNFADQLAFLRSRLLQ